MRRADAARILREPQLAALLLISLVAHLLLMTTPLHGAMLAPGMAEPGHERQAEELASGLWPSWSLIGAAHGRHCAMEWSSPDQPILTFLGRADALSSGTPLLGLPVRWRSLLQAMGPPQQVDRQALLQVFRM